MQPDLFAPHAPTTLRMEDGPSYAEIVIEPAQDGSWGFSASDCYEAPSVSVGAFPAFLDALDEAFRKLAFNAYWNGKHPFSGKVHLWLRSIEPDYWGEA